MYRLFTLPPPQIWLVLLNEFVTFPLAGRVRYTQVPSDGDFKNVSKMSDFEEKLFYEDEVTLVPTLSCQLQQAPELTGVGIHSSLSSPLPRPPCWLARSLMAQ